MKVMSYLLTRIKMKNNIVWRLSFLTIAIISLIICNFSNTRLMAGSGFISGFFLCEFIWWDKVKNLKFRQKI